MLFNSLAFLVFFPTVCILYWVLPLKCRNILLLIASYYFYMNWEPLYALLIAFTSVTTWWVGNKMLGGGGSHKRTFLILGIGVNLAILFVYRYLNFVSDSIFVGLDMLGIRMTVPEFKLLLPVGISFYTFQAVGYCVDVYRGTVKPEKSLATYALFVSFFPQLVAGPIERAKNLLPQFHESHKFNGEYIIEGIKMMLWGYFMKLCIAENVAPYVDAVFNNLDHHNGTSLILASLFFTFQIFCDFGGYSLIAIGTAKCLGFTLMQNFNHPYLACSVKDFWRRWHISLSSWFAEYIYIPLGGNRCSEIKHQRNIFITMLVSGVWHGANWTFVVWGVYHGILQMINSLLHKIEFFRRSNVFLRIVGFMLTFTLMVVGWVIFRSATVRDAVITFEKMLFYREDLYLGEGVSYLLLPIVLIILLMFREIKDEFGWHIHLMHNSNKIIAAVSTGLLLVVILLCAKFESGQFIYFQF